jgi:hypothetical protein
MDGIKDSIEDRITNLEEVVGALNNKLNQQSEFLKKIETLLTLNIEANEVMAETIKREDNRINTIEEQSNVSTRMLGSIPEVIKTLGDANALANDRILELQNSVIELHKLLNQMKR